jgi:hypothetical protein
MRSSRLVVVLALGWFSTGLGAAVAAAQCNDNAECGIAQYCQKSTGDCDGIGVCSVRPMGCPDIWDPVCGCDGATYGNECLAALAGVNVASDGECPPPPCRDNSECSLTELCLKTAGDCGGLGLCTAKPLMCIVIWMPVCGCDELTYANECEALATGVNVAYEGECLVSCTSDHDCSPLEYCDTAHNGCGGVGACRLQPNVCSEEYDPVCGCNEFTFDNACFAAMGGITVYGSGVCGPCPFDPSADCVFSDRLESGGAARWSLIVGD